MYDSIQLTGAGGMRYEWSPAWLVSDPTLPDPWAHGSGDSTTHFVLTAINTFCRDTDTVGIYFDRCLDDITAPVPQIITPNNDGANDVWIVSDIDYFTQNSVEIYNRWGHLVFRAEPYENNWDGTNTRGEPLPEGTYYFIINLANGLEPRVGYLIIHR
ncbi:MAG: gliding motility-associated C-terminal domain-containing protein [Bacteroidales bacterium]